MSDLSTAVESEDLLKVDPRARERKRRSEFVQISLFVSLSSLLIALYAIFLSLRLAPAASQHDLDQATLMLASELAALSLNHGRFGPVGLLDTADGGRRQLSFNRLEASLRVVGISAKKLGFDSMSELLSRDAREVSALVREFAQLEREEVNASSEQIQGRESLSHKLRKSLLRNGPASVLRDLKITVGGVKEGKYSATSSPLPPLLEENQAFFADKGFYKAHVPVPIWDNYTFSFYENAESTRLIPVSQFRAISQDELASAVLVEAEFEVLERGKSKENRRMQSCALLGAPALKGNSTLFMLSFPHGRLSKFGSLADLFSPANYNAEGQGKCYQAIDGELPGQGRLLPLFSSSAPLACSRALYDFMLSAGPELNPQRLSEVLKKPFSELQLRQKELRQNDERTKQYSFNSALMRDTGASAFALLNQSKKQEAGQKALANAFSGKSREELLPAFAFPALVDENGFLSLPSETTFDTALLHDFLSSLHQTNIAGIESMKSARLIIERMEGAIAGSQRKQKVLAEEFESIQKNSAKLKLAAAPNLSETQNSSKEQELKRQIEQISERLAREKARYQSYLKTSDKAKLAAKNGEAAARSSYQIGEHMSTFVSQGVKKVTAPVKGFLLGRKVVFIPHKTPVDQDDIYGSFSAGESGADAVFDPEKDQRAESGYSEKENDWLSPKFSLMEIPDHRFQIEGKSFFQYWETRESIKHYQPYYVMLSSSELCRKGRPPMLFAGQASPFENGALNNLQLCFFAPACIKSGAGKEPVYWSLLLRDLASTRAPQGVFGLESTKSNWCIELGMDEERCPSLASEIMIRSPLPGLLKDLSGVYLQDPSGLPPVPLYPPLPPELL